MKDSTIFLFCNLIFWTLACEGGGSSKECELDTGYTGGTPMEIDGTFQGQPFSAVCGMSSCSPPDIGLAYVRCDDNGDIMIEGAAQTIEDTSGTAYVMDITLYLTSTTTSGSSSFLGEDGNNGGVWVSPGGANFTGADEDALTNTLVVDQFEAGGFAEGTYIAEWGGETPITVEGTFNVSCPEATSE